MRVIKIDNKSSDTLGASIHINIEYIQTFALIEIDGVEHIRIKLADGTHIVTESNLEDFQLLIKRA